jgi:hypothetical protein
LAVFLSPLMSLCPRDVSERPEHVAQADLIDHSLELKHGFAAVLEVSHHSFRYSRRARSPADTRFIAGSAS